MEGRFLVVGKSSSIGLTNRVSPGCLLEPRALMVGFSANEDASRLIQAASCAAPVVGEDLIDGAPGAA